MDRRGYVQIDMDNFLPYEVSYGLLVPATALVAVDS